MNFRNFFGQFFNDSYFCGLDIGSRKIKACLFFVRNPQDLDLLAVSELDTKGFQDTSVNDISEFSSAIGSALDILVKKTQIRFRDVYLSIGGDLVETRPSRAVIPLAERGNKVITLHDIDRVRSQARILGVRLDDDVLHDFVQQFRVDDVNIALNPLGLYGRKLEVESLLAVTNVTRMRNISKAVKQAGFEVNKIFFGAHVLSEALLDKRQRLDGAVLVDLGARSTQVLVYKDGLLKNYVRADFGGEDMTLRIAQTLGVARDLAEDIKRSYARVSEAKSSFEDEEILIKKEQSFVPVKRLLLNNTIETEVVRLVDLINGALRDAGISSQLKGGLVITGGGGLLPGLAERVESACGLSVRLGRPINGLNNAAAFCACTSVAETAYKGSGRYVFDSRKPEDWWQAFRSRLDEICNEYF